jgi:uncharacterized membrane protein
MTWSGQMERAMEHDNLTLYVASYDDEAAANDDFQALKDAREAGLDVVGAVVMTHSSDGDVDVEESGGGEVSGGAGIGAVGGLVVGLFAPPLLLTTAIGAGLGAAIGGLVKKHEEKEMGVEVDEYLPPGSSAIVAVVDDVYLDRLTSTITRADKRISKAIDSGDYDKVRSAVQKSSDQVTDAIESD